VSAPQAEEPRPLGGPMTDVSEEFGPSVVRLSAWQWLVAGGIVLAVLILAPWIAERRAGFAPGPDYRHPYAYSEDYWLYERYSKHAASQHLIPVIGDSVVWGHYVGLQGTLPRFLNREAGSPRFANLGLDGTRPMALTGLIRYYCRDISGQAVLLHLNPLWMSSPDTDLYPRPEPAESRPTLKQTLMTLLVGKGEAPPPPVKLNHTRLLPQLSGRPYGYRPGISEMVGVGLERTIPYAAWLRHTRMVGYDSFGLQSWSLQNPYRSPLAAFTAHLPQPEDRPEGEPVPWTKGGVERQDFPWVPINESYQWRCFRETVELLQSRGNRVFVLVGPMNTHLMAEASRQRYEGRKDAIEAWLTTQGVPYYAPDALPSDLYADASHPLEAGYAEVAKGLFSQRPFREWLAKP